MSAKTVARLTAKKERLYAKMNDVYRASCNISEFSSRSNEDFMVKSELIEDMQKQFEIVVDELNEAQLDLDPKFKVDYQCVSAFEDLYAKVRRVRNRINQNSQSVSSVSHNNSNMSSLKIKLPPIELPMFDGRIESWPKFYESFKSNIHENTQLNDSQRVQYLMGKLSNNAIKITAGIVPSGDTYQIIWQSLVKKYQDKRKLGTHYLNNILDANCCINTVSSLDAFVEGYSASVLALKQLMLDDLSDFMLLHCALRKLDMQTIQAFESSVRGEEIPSYNMLISFIRDQVKILERSHVNKAGSAGRQYMNKPPCTSSTRNVHKTFIASNSGTLTGSNYCLFCRKSDHLIYNCNQFKLESPNARFEFIKSKNGCVKCLDLCHTVTSCNSANVCDVCRKCHHTLLHFERKSFTKYNRQVPKAQRAPTLDTSLNATVVPNTIASSDIDCRVPKSGVIKDPPQVLHSASEALSYKVNGTPGSHILLSTAQVLAKQKLSNNNKVIIRCLIDTGSQNNLITVDCCKTLNIPIIPLSNSFIKGVGLGSRPIRGYVFLDIESRVYPNNKYSIYALVVDCITDRLPAHYIAKGDMGYLEKIPLADLSWNIPGNVDAILGAQLFPYIYLGDRVESGTNAPLALSTVFGYVLMGDYPNIANVASPCAIRNANAAFSFSAIPLDDLMQKFWEVEELPKIKYLSPEETECENLYVSTVHRADDGRYSVALPFCKDPNELGNSRSTALRRFMALERKFRQSPDLRDSYNQVIGEYIVNGYISEVADSDIADDGYYIPHHAVMRADKPMPRIVLDASSKTHTGLSLNDILHTGPNLQADLFLLLINFRLFPVAMTADIKQMYLQLGVPVEHRKYLQILYRFADDEKIKTFQFNRLPFGLKSSPYLAMRTVRQLAEDMRSHFPAAAQVAESNFFMDDFVHSVADDVIATRLSRELISLFQSGAFNLVKWTTNSAILLQSLPDSHRGPIEFIEGSNNATKVLGLSWHPVDDNFVFRTSHIQEKCTKRTILSVVARLFDVLGLVAPVILYAKLLIKELWLCNIGWDDTPPESIIQRFSALVQEFSLISVLRIPRHSGVLNHSCTVLLVAFCDASMHGYGSVIYLHTTDPNGNITVRLLCAKSKVSPTKIITLARLELCAALLMAKLIKTVHDSYSMRLPIAGVYAFSDSTITLSWIHSSPHRWSVFVSNRVAKIQENVKPENFYHIAGIENPSDCLSRGMLPSQLVSHELWWDGPKWILRAPSEWPIKPFIPSNYETIPEHKLNVLMTTVQCETSLLNLLAKRISSWDKLLRIVVYILKFIKKVGTSASSVQKLLIAEKFLLSAVQNSHFSEDIKLLKKGKLPSVKCRNLSVFLDEENILRVGGRLTKSDLPFEVKHPILLPKHDHIVNLIINYYHVMNCHTGPGLLMSLLRQRYWILDARTVVRANVRKCNYCFRVNPTHPTPKMADLPTYRVMETTKAFIHTGVDYGGPIKITLTRRRGQRTQKAYICLFVCLVTKAIHIELVSDLTSNAFLAAFSRFISRRGPVACLYSDNGTNFIGAKAQLDDLYTFLLKSNFHSALKQELTSHRIEWKMIPPRSPHFGGMWESNIKSVKSHLYRVIGTQILTYEELLTVLVQIECILNSRPLTVVSSDPDPDVLTPAHFLMSTPLQFLPAVNLTDARISLTERKQLLDSLVQSFWKKWRLAYLHTLQVRQKWSTPAHPIQIGTVVIVGQDDSPPLAWPLGVIIQVHPGSDNVVRVATVKTKCGIFKRPVVKLYPIPNQ